MLVKTAVSCSGVPSFSTQLWLLFQPPAQAGLGGCREGSRNWLPAIHVEFPDWVHKSYLIPAEPKLLLAYGSDLVGGKFTLSHLLKEKKEVKE